jgi:hypothetical protein
MESRQLPPHRGGRALKLDLYKRHRAEYIARRAPIFVTVGPARYLAIAGRGAPGSPAFARAMGALYAVAFTIKMAKKFAGQDYAVMKLEGLWWGQRRGRWLIDEPQRLWRWQLMIRVPSFVTPRDRRAALRMLAERGKDPLTRRVKLETLRERRCVQILHVGPYDTEHTSLELMQALAGGAQVRFRGRHHEIYLSDPRRVPPPRLKTILRHPVT